MNSFSYLFTLLVILLQSVISHLSARRFNDFGNFKNTTYDPPAISHVNDKPTTTVSLYDFVNTNRIFDGCMRGMSFVKNKKSFLLGPVQYNIFEGIKVDIDDFFIDKTPITVKEYKKFLRVLNNYLEKKKNGELFPLTTEDLINKYLKLDDNSIDPDFKKYFDRYIALREELQKKLSEQYIEELHPDLSVFRNDDYSKKYFTEDKYEEYPIVGIYFNQAQEYCKWRTLYLNEYYLQEATRKNRCFIWFSLPTYPQYCYAASGDNPLALYAFNTINLRDKNDKLKANFNAGQYDNNAIGLAKVKTYPPNSWDLYDMSGNVNEWLDDTEKNYLPTVDNNEQEVKMTTGGSWIDCASDIEIGKYKKTHILETKNDLGFRCVATITR